MNTLPRGLSPRIVNINNIHQELLDEISELLIKLKDKDEELRRVKSDDIKNNLAKSGVVVIPGEVILNLHDRSMYVASSDGQLACITSQIQFQIGEQNDI